MEGNYIRVLPYGKEDIDGNLKLDDGKVRTTQLDETNLTPDKKEVAVNNMA